MGIQILPVVVPPEGTLEGGAGADHPMRLVTRQVAFERDGWTPERSVKVGELFDGLASEWHTRDIPGRHAPVDDALARGGPLAGPTLELGSGTGMSTSRLVETVPPVLCADLSLEMLKLAPRIAPLMQADGSRLPLTDGAIGCLVLVNMLLFPAEVDRVLAADGALVWVNSVGASTPIHLSADDVVAALPGSWDGVASEAGHGTWCVLRRS
jgi:SAM-dependent methyltransferase